MRPNNLGFLTVFTLLTVVGFTLAVPAPSNVSVACDSYGVMVEWMTDGLREQAEFLLQLIPNHGENVSVATKSLRFNISNMLEDPGYNFYVVKVKAIDGEHESEFAESPIFSFNFRQTLAKIICDLEFPTVKLFPRDGKLFVQFTNPLHLYRDTPALRHLLETEKLKYAITSDQTSNECLVCSPDCPPECSLECTLESETCESNLSFPEKREEYCVTLFGRIRQTHVKKTDPYCYRGTLNPGPPVFMYIIMVLGSFAAFLTLVMATVLPMKKRHEKTKNKILSRFPDFLKNDTTHLIKPLKMDPEPVDSNPRVEPAVKSPPKSDSTCDLQEDGTGLETRPSAGGDSLTDCSDLTDRGMWSSAGCSEQDTSLYRDDLNESESTDSFSGYDMRHTLVEISPGDTVNSYRS